MSLSCTCAAIVGPLTSILISLLSLFFLASLFFTEVGLLLPSASFSVWLDRLSGAQVFLGDTAVPRDVQKTETWRTFVGLSPSSAS